VTLCDWAMAVERQRLEWEWGGEGGVPTTVIEDCIDIPAASEDGNGVGVGDWDDG
jgi:hypothetical protein